MDISKNADGFVVVVTTHYCESTIAGGSIKTRTETFDRLSENELDDVVCSTTDAAIPGEPLLDRMGMFTLV
uniref:Uncharacterized protein n=1 Tax=uncultured prokaryote TaxID=198431 RepID=A0A0H5Q5G2_9ZZZZ|nr:hypothetical protein [uncultured prokaryote]